MLNHKNLTKGIKSDINSASRLVNDLYTKQKLASALEKLSYLEDMLEGYETFTHIIEKQEKQL